MINYKKILRGKDMKLLMLTSLVAMSLPAMANNMMKFSALSNDVVLCAAYFDMKVDKTSDDIMAGSKLMQLVVNEHGMDNTHALLSKEIGKIKKASAEEMSNLNEKCTYMVIQQKRS